ncbi:MAG: sugar ABC transporter substrate-binding protein [Eubacteriales bacterium]|nr:sugar ABC transporter substrate-binding protein [Eubacteriales bacterium]
MNDELSNQISTKVKVGISFPSRSIPRWEEEALLLEKQLKNNDYDINLFFDKESNLSQKEQIDFLINDNCNIIIIATIAPKDIEISINRAKRKGIIIILYDNLINNIEGIDYYITSNDDNWGELQAKYIIDKLDINNNEAIFNIELFALSPEDINSNKYFNQAMKILEPYIESKRIKIVSFQKEKSQCCIFNSSKDEAKKRMTLLIKNQKYSPNGLKDSPNNAKIDAILSPNDDISSGIIEALLEANYNNTNMPIITGATLSVEAKENINNNLQSMSIYNDTNTFTKELVNLINDIVDANYNNIKIKNNTHNGLINIPTLVIEPTIYN